MVGNPTKEKFDWEESAYKNIKMARDVPPEVCHSAVQTWESVHPPAASLDSLADYLKLGEHSSPPFPNPPKPESGLQ